MHGYQDKAVDHIIENPRAAMLLDMGFLFVDMGKI